MGDRLRVSDPITGSTRVVTVAAIATGDGLIQNGMLYGWRDRNDCSAHTSFRAVPS